MYLHQILLIVMLLVLPHTAGILEEFVLQVLDKELAVELVTHRFELQEGAQLQGREPELVASLKSMLHLQEK